MPDAEPLSSELIQLQIGSYRVVESLGSGGMSSVYRAVHVESGHEVALKVLPRTLAKSSTVLQRFLREARSAESLEHPNIVSIYDRGLDRNRHYLVLEYVPGADLHNHVQKRGPFSAGEAVRVIREVAMGLKYAAKRGLIHRDIKPSNILRSTTGQVKIIDLGLALQAEHEDERVTREGTTVGTVDYMAPEQARDSRAISTQSDQYSLGCTFYFLLTGVPPFPGGDITEKLTRHAKAPPPDVRDLRPDVPEPLSRLMIRMMAKRPEDRYASYDDLITALDAIPVEAGDDSPGVTLEPLGETPRRSGDSGVYPPVAPSSMIRSGDEPPSSIPEISLRNLPADLLLDQRQSALLRPSLVEAGATNSPRAASTESPKPLPEAGPPMSAQAWIITWVALGVFCILLVIGLDQLLSLSSGTPRLITADEVKESAPALVERGGGTSWAQPGLRGPATFGQPGEGLKPAAPPRQVPAPVAWVEPEDPPDPEADSELYDQQTLASYLPEWALPAIPERVEGPIVQVRRVADPRDPGIQTSLRSGLDRLRGTVEIVDTGPFAIDDFRVPGDPRMIRGRSGIRPIIRIDRPALEIVRLQTAVVPLEGKNLILDSLDLVVNLREFPPGQSALFGCSGSSLTLRNCTITVINPANVPFVVVRSEGSAARPSRVRIEKTLVRGALSGIIEVARGAADIAVRESILLTDQGPILRLRDGDPTAERRFAAVGSVLACRGPGIAFDERGAGKVAHRPLVARLYDTVFGRYQGVGIASLLSSEDAAAAPVGYIDWRGDRNVYCGWLGYFASGPGHTIQLPSLAVFRSTWNATDPTSMEIRAAWPRTGELVDVLPKALNPFLPSHEFITARVATPRPYLLTKTVGLFAVPVVPIPEQASVGVDQGKKPRPGLINPMADAGEGRAIEPGIQPGFGPASTALPGINQGGAFLDLTFDSEQNDWHGDLGAFLRDKMIVGVRRARVRVLGSGPKRCSPVRLPDGLVLELAVDPPARNESPWLTWLPEAELPGKALFELHGGGLSLSRFRFRADESSPIASVVHVEDGDLFLNQCQMIAPAGAEARTRHLLTFRATSTKPRQPGGDPGIFGSACDRPVCSLVDCTLITEGSALKVELGRGLVALSQCAVSAAGDAIELLPARVSRPRFDADLELDHCTLLSPTNIIRLGPWPGQGLGPDRPWVVSSQASAYFSPPLRKTREGVLLRADIGAFTGGSLFWQGTGDAVEVDAFAALGEGPPTNRNRDIHYQWVNLWGSTHVRGVTGPRAAGGGPSVRLLERPRPGRIEPADLALDPAYHPGRPQLDVGADLTRQGLMPRPATVGRHR